MTHQHSLPEPPIDGRNRAVQPGRLTQQRVSAKPGVAHSDLAILRDQAELFGPVASDPMLWRALSEIGAPQRRKIA